MTPTSPPCLPSPPDHAPRETDDKCIENRNCPDISEGWEFKILRSATGAFRNPERLRHAIEEEGRAGWVLLEKFDNQRLRFKRPASAKLRDSALGVDPYRTTYGMSEGKLAALILTIVFGTIALAILIVALSVHK